MCTENSQNTVKTTTTTTTTENILVIFNFLLGHYPLILQTFPLTLKHKIELQNKTRVKKNQYGKFLYSKLARLTCFLLSK